MNPYLSCPNVTLHPLVDNFLDSSLDRGAPAKPMRIGCFVNVAAGSIGIRLTFACGQSLSDDFVFRLH
jgi:hypothetical protein